MKIKVLHYVFGPCMKGYDISAKKVIVQMGQKTIGLSEELLSYPDVLETLGELAFGDTIEKNAPFEKIYFAPLPGGKWVIGRGIKGMDRAGRKAYFFHHLVVDEADLIKIKGNPFVIYRKFKFFENETDLPENRLIPPTEIDISKEDNEFPVLDSTNKPHVENLLSDIFSKKSGQPVWVIINRGEERFFIESLFGIIPINDRKQMSFSTDFYNSYSIQHHFQLVTVNTENEIPYKNCTIYNFVDGIFPGTASGKTIYLKTISQLPPGEVKSLADDISQLQVNYKNINQLLHCREIIDKYIREGKTYLHALYDTIPLEIATVLLGVGDPEVEPHYQAFCKFYGNFINEIEPEWFIKMYSPSPPPLKLFFAFFKLLEFYGNIPLRDKIFITVYGHLKTVGNGEILNPLAAQFPGLFQEMLDYLQEETQQLFYLVQLPELEKDIRISITGRINRNMYKWVQMPEKDEDKIIEQLPHVIELLDRLEIDTNALKIIRALYTIKEKRKFPTGEIEKYSIDEETYRKFVEIGMNMVKEYEISFKKMCNYLYVSNYNRVFIEMLLEFIQGPRLNFNPVELLIYMETNDWLEPDTRKGIFAYLKKGKIKFSQIKKYQDFLKRKGKDLPAYKPIWKEIEKKAPKGLLDSLFG